MEGRLLFKDCSLLGVNGALLTGRAVVVEAPLVSRVVEDAEAPVLPGDWAVACRGRLLTPGRLDAFHRLPTPRNSARPFSTLELEALSAFALARALREGVTTVMESLLPPERLAEGLETQARVAERLGARLLTGYALPLSTSPEEARPLLEANADFALRRADHPEVRGLLGFSASSGAWEGLLLGQLAEVQRETRALLHGLLPRDAPAGAVQGLLNAELLGAYSALACEGPMPAHAWQALAQTDALLTLIPWDKGALKPPAFIPATRLALGTGGRGSMAEALTLLSSLPEAAHELHPGVSARRRDGEEWTGGVHLCSSPFGSPLRPIEAGSLADLVLYDSLPGEDGASGVSSWLTLARARAAWTVVGGRVVVREGQLLGHEYLELAEEAARAWGSRARPA